MSLEISSGLPWITWANQDGEIAGVGNGNPKDMTSFQQPRKTTFQGICLAIVRPKGGAGKIILKASSNGLESASVDILVQ